MVDLHVRPDLEEIGWIIHINFDDEVSVKEVLEDIKSDKVDKHVVDFYGDGHAAAKIVDCIEEYTDSLRNDKV